jgi:hypothetical protein
VHDAFSRSDEGVSKAFPTINKGSFLHYGFGVDSMNASFNAVRGNIGL